MIFELIISVYGYTSVVVSLKASLILLASISSFIWIAVSSTVQADTTA